jgi:hypothetical protein
MAKTVGGHCLCGFVRYEYVGVVGPANYCHCEDCRRSTGSAFNIGVRFDSADFRLVEGKTKSFSKQGDSGNALTRHFCPECGSPIFTSSEVHPDCVFVKAGTLDDPSVVAPTHQIWVSSAVKWGRPPTDIVSYERGRT